MVHVVDLVSTPDAPNPTHIADDVRAVVTLSPPAAAGARTLAEAMDVSVAEAVRRGLMLLDMVIRLDAEEELIVHNIQTGERTRLRFEWQTFGPLADHNDGSPDAD